MKHKIISELIQEMLERMMVLGMSSTDEAYNMGRIQGLQDAIDILQSSLGKVKK